MLNYFPFLIPWTWVQTCFSQLKIGKAGLLLPFLGLFLPFWAWAQTDSLLRFEKLGVKEGLSQNAVRDILHDRKGFMWFASEDGLNRYDGYRFQVYRNKKNDTTTISGNHIEHICEDQSGNIWATSNIIGLNKYDRTKDRFVRYEDFAKRSVRTVICDQQNSVWVGTNKGLFRIRQENGKETIEDLGANKIFEALKNEIVISFRKNGDEIWLGTANGLIFRYKNEKLQAYSIGKKVSINSLSLSKKNILWVGTSQGLWAVDIEKNTSQEFLHDPKNPKSLSDNQIVAVLADSKNRIWVGTHTKGLNVYYPDNQEFRRITKKHSFESFGLSDNNIRSIYEDKQGVIWVGTSLGGLSKFNPFRFKFDHFFQDPTNSNSLNNNSVRGFWVDDRQQWWISTQQGGVNLYDPKTGKFTHFSHDPQNPQSLSENYVRGIAQDKNGAVWVSTYRRGICRFTPKGKDYEIRRFSLMEKNIPQNMSENISSLLIEKDYLWTISYLGQVFRAHTDSLVFQEVLPAFIEPPNITPLSFYKNDQKLWIGTNKGLSYYDFKTQKREIIKNFPQTIVRSIYQDSETSLYWLATNLGLLCFNDKTQEIRVFDTEKGLPNNALYGILHDKSKNQLWFSTNRGLSQMDLRTETFKNYDIFDGLQDNEFNSNAFYQSPDGLFFFGGINGFNVFRPSDIHTDSSASIPALTDFQINNRSVKIGENSAITKHINEVEEINLTYRDYIFSIEMAALHYTQPQKNRMAYFLENFDSTWTEVQGNRRFVTYTNLPSGDYIFRLKVSNADGIWSSLEKRVKISIAPPFWETWWFKTLVVLLSIGSFAAWYKRRTYNLQKQNERLENEVRVRTQQIVEQKSEILQQNEELQQSQEEIKAQKDLLERKNELLENYTYKMDRSIHAAQMIQQAILPPQAKLDEILTEYFILNRPKDVVSGDFYWVNQIGAKKFVIVADCTGHGVSGAFMTMIGNTLLDKIIKVWNIYDPSEILETAHHEIRTILQQTETGNTDGMDVAVAVLETPSDNNPDAVQVQFAGAKRPLYYLERGQTEIGKLSGARKTVGGFANEKKSHLTETIVLPKNSLIYLCSDGYADQNDKARKSFTEKRFAGLLSIIQKKTLAEQKKFLEQVLEEHMEGTEQRDDILIVGVRV